MYVDDIKLAGKKQNINPMWKLLNKEVDLGESTSSTMFIWVALKESVILLMILAQITEICFQSRISAGAQEKLPTRASGKHDAETISSCCYDMEGHAKRCVERYCELAANKTTQQ